MSMISEEPRVVPSYVLARMFPEPSFHTIMKSEPSLATAGLRPPATTNGAPQAPAA